MATTQDDETSIPSAVEKGLRLSKNGEVSERLFIKCSEGLRPHGG